MEKHFKADAKNIVDMLFDTKYFKDEVTRDNMVAVEEYLESMLSMRFESYLTLKSLTDSLKLKQE